MFGPLPAYDPLLGDPLPLNGINTPARNNRNGGAAAGDGGPAAGPGGGTLIPGDVPDRPTFENMNRAALLAWQERQRRQRTLRMLMMFLMLLLLMDGDEPPNSRDDRRRRSRAGRLRKSRGQKLGYLDDDGNPIGPLHPEVYRSRLEEDLAVRTAVLDNGRSRYHELVSRNDGRDVERELRERIGEKLREEVERGVVSDEASGSVEDGDADDDAVDAEEFDEKKASEKEAGDESEDGGRSSRASAAARDEAEELDGLEVFHYPRNATGYYRGLWVRTTAANRTLREAASGGGGSELAKSKHEQNDGGEHAEVIQRNVTAEQVHGWAQERLVKRREDVGLMFLPPGVFVEPDEPIGKNATSGSKDAPTGSHYAKSESSWSTPAAEVPPSSASSTNPSLSLTKEAGRAAFQLYSRPVPAMNELSVVDGLVKLYDGMTTSFVSRRTDVLLRVRGVMVHGAGKMSLVTSSNVRVPGEREAATRRRSVLGIRKVDKAEFQGAETEEDEFEGSAPDRAGRDAFGEDEELSDDLDPSETQESADRRRRRLQSTLEELVDASKDLEAAKRKANGGTTISAASEETTTRKNDNEESDQSATRGIGALMSQIRAEVMDAYSSLYMHDDRVHRLSKDDEVSRKSAEDEGWTLIRSVDDGAPPDSDSKDDVDAFRGIALEDLPDMISDEPTSQNDVVGDESTQRKLDKMDFVEDWPFPDPDESAKSGDHLPVHPTTGPDEDESYYSDVTVASADYAPISLAHNASSDGTDPSAFRRSTLTLSATSERTTPARYVYPHPYVTDDADGSVRRASSPATRRLPGRERALEANAADCEFEINVDVQSVKWTYGEWRRSMERRLRMGGAFDPYWNVARPSSRGAGSDKERAARMKRSQYLLVMKSQLDFLEEQTPREALVMTMVGDIESENCDFRSFVNVTAMRTNWEHTTAKAINYSFYMMLTCLTQIVILLRQLLHTQSQSVATNVSLLCIGWQTVLDAILCISHIFLCLVMQPLFTAFASVAFFKLLIFCVIEMKYMAIIIQARNNANGAGLTQEDLRRQITLLHLKFYGALMSSIVAFWYLGQSRRTLYVLLLYSFWVPQIVLNVITESRRPMHPYYVYGMSATRSVAPFYVFAVRNNFLREVNPDFPTEPGMCQLLLLWIAVQTAILFAQGKYGTRFMIPQRFLPPKFDYGRPIPPSLLPRPAATAGASSHSNGSMTEIELGPLINGDASPSRDNGVARNRRGGGGGGRARLGSRADDAGGAASMSEDTGDHPTLDCVICYNEIDVEDNRGYMLAPCDHIFHRRCLEQWMEVKMECPICRCNLPSI